MSDLLIFIGYYVDFFIIKDETLILCGLMKQQSAHHRLYITFLTFTFHITILFYAII